MRPSKIINLYSAGGVVFRQGESGVEVSLIATRGGNHWSFPKGLIDGKENATRTALREVREETGLDARIIGPLGETAYWYNIRSENAKCRKKVRFFLMEYLESDLADHDDEVADTRWVSLESAAAELTYAGDKAILKKAIEMIGKIINEKPKKMTKKKAAAKGAKGAKGPKAAKGTDCDG